MKIPTAFENWNLSAHIKYYSHTDNLACAIIPSSKASFSRSEETAIKYGSKIIKIKRKTIRPYKCFSALKATPGINFLYLKLEQQNLNVQLVNKENPNF